MCRRKNQQKNNGMWCKRNTHMRTISPLFYPLNKTQTHYSWLNCFFNKIILIPTLECTVCLILTWFPPTLLIWSISWLRPTAAHANYFCDHLQLSRSKWPEHLREKKKHLFLAQYLHFVIFGITFWNHAVYLELCEHVWYFLFLHLILIYYCS